jgi:hypothetical protein
MFRAHIQAADDARVFRCSTSRANISYQMIDLASSTSSTSRTSGTSGMAGRASDEAQEGQLDQLIRRCLVEVERLGGRMIMFANTRENARQLAARYQLGAYYSDAPDKQGKWVNDLMAAFN